MHELDLIYASDPGHVLELQQLQSHVQTLLQRAVATETRDELISDGADKAKAPRDPADQVGARTPGGEVEDAQAAPEGAAASKGLCGAAHEMLATTLPSEPNSDMGRKIPHESEAQAPFLMPVGSSKVVAKGEEEESPSIIGADEEATTGISEMAPLSPTEDGRSMSAAASAPFEPGSSSVREEPAGPHVAGLQVSGPQIGSTQPKRAAADAVELDTGNGPALRLAPTALGHETALETMPTRTGYETAGTESSGDLREMEQLLRQELQGAGRLDPDLEAAEEASERRLSSSGALALSLSRSV